MNQPEILKAVFGVGFYALLLAISWPRGHRLTWIGYAYYGALGAIVAVVFGWG